MDAEIKAEWTTRLRSNLYRQGKGRLHDKEDGTYCCLGVLCEMAVEAGIVVREDFALWPDQEPYLVKYTPTEGGRAGEEAVLPYAVMDWAGLNSSNPQTKQAVNNAEAHEGFYYRALAELNDNEMTFSEIADVIETDL